MRKTAIAILTACLAISPVWAALAPEALTWQDCVRLAAQNNPDLLASLRAMESSRADYKGSYNGVLPRLSLSNSYSESSSNRRAIWTAQGNASLDLIDFGAWASIQSSLATYKQSQASMRVASGGVLLNLYRAFSDLLYAQDAVDVNATILNTWKINAQMVTLRYQSGRESKGNMMNTEAQFLQAQSALEQAVRDVRVAQQQLSQAVGKDGFSVLVVTGTWSAAAVPTPRPDFEALLLNEPRIQLREAAVEQARAAIKSAHSTLWPTLSLNYSRGVQGRTEFPQNPFWTFSGAATYPLFGQGPTSTYYASQAAQRAYDQAWQDLRAIKNQARTDLESAWASFAQAEDQIRVQRAFLEASRQRKGESDVRYQSGLMSFEDWIRVVTDYVNFQTSFLRTEQNLILAEAQWRFAKGEQL